MSAASLGLHELVSSGLVPRKHVDVSVVESYLRLTGMPAARLEERLAVDGLDIPRAAEALMGNVGELDIPTEVQQACRLGSEILAGDSHDAALAAVGIWLAEQSSIGVAGKRQVVPQGLLDAVETEALRYTRWLLSPWPDLSAARSSAVTCRRLGLALLELAAGAEALLGAARSDRERVAEVFGVDPMAAMQDYVACVGDRHGVERSWFIKGSVAGVYLKSRTGQIDDWYLTFVDWLNAKAGEDLLRAPRVLPIHGRTWAAEVIQCEVTPDETVGVVRRFGALLAVMEFLGATDIHSSNVVIDGQFPVPVDLECLFHPLREGQPAKGSTYSAVEEWLSAGPLRTGILPVRRPGNSPEGTDSSALGGPLDLGPSRNSTILTLGAIVNPAHHVEAILAGYERTYEVLGKHADELAGSDSFFYGASGLRARYIHWDTSVLNMLREFVNAPQWLKSGVDRSVGLDRLWHAVEGEPIELVSATTRELFDDVIPRFEHDVGSPVVLDALGQVVAGVRPNGPQQALERLRTRPAGPLPHSLEVEASLRSLALGVPAEHASLGPREVMSDELSSLGRSLLDCAFRRDGSITWITPSSLGGSFRMAPAGGGIYDGLAGMALAFDALAVAFPDVPLWAEIVDDVASTILRDWRDLSAADRGTSPFVATPSGALYLAMEARSLAKEKRAALVDRSLSDVRAALAAEGSADFLFGLPGLLRVAALADARLAVDLSDEVESAATRLLTLAEHGPGDLPPWATLHGRPIQGLAHGVSGILLGLASLPTSWDAAIAPVVRAGVALEDSWFDPANGEWLDQRANPAGARPAYPAAWCTGSVGIGFVRTVLAERWPDEISGSQLAHVGAVSRVSDLSLCHGWSSLQLFRAALGAPPLLEPPELWDMTSAPQSNGVAAGLLLGTAGHLYALARLSVGGSPTVLTLSVGDQVGT